MVIIIYVTRLRKFPIKHWTIEQKWGAILLFFLMFYNNPFFPLEILVSGWFPIFLNRVFYASFVVLLLLFWLSMFDGVRYEQSQSRNKQLTFKRFYLPKIILVGLFWICGIVLYTWSHLQQLNHPAYESRNEMPGYIAFQIIMLLLLIIYIFWLVFVICRSCSDSKLLPYLGNRVKFFGVFTLFIILTVVAGLLFTGIAGSTFNNASEFTSFLALINLYVYTLSIVYLPSPSYVYHSTLTDSNNNINNNINSNIHNERISMVPSNDDDDDRFTISHDDIDNNSTLELNDFSSK